MEVLPLDLKMLSLKHTLTSKSTATLQKVLPAELMLESSRTEKLPMFGEREKLILKMATPPLSHSSRPTLVELVDSKEKEEKIIIQ